MSVAICERFKAVADRAAERPQTAEELIEIKSFVDGADRIVEDILVDVGRVRTQVRVGPRKRRREMDHLRRSMGGDL